MGNHTIEVFGITPISHFPKCPPHHPCTEFCEIDHLYILAKKKNVGTVQHISFKVCIHSFKTICTPVGKKLVILGKKLIRVIFSRNCSDQSTHVGDYAIPFCAFILLKDSHDEVAKICTVVEDVTINFLDCTHFTVTSIIFLCPIFKRDHEFCPCPPDPAISQFPQLDSCSAKFPCPDEDYTSHHHSYDVVKHYNYCHLYKIQSTCKHCRSYFNEQT